MSGRVSQHLGGGGVRGPCTLGLRGAVCPAAAEMQVGSPASLPAPPTSLRQRTGRPLEREAPALPRASPLGSKSNVQFLGAAPQRPLDSGAQATLSGGPLWEDVSLPTCVSVCLSVCCVPVLRFTSAHFLLPQLTWPHIPTKKTGRYILSFHLMSLGRSGRDLVMSC